jgi:hypothetical protein
MHSVLFMVSLLSAEGPSPGKTSPPAAAATVARAPRAPLHLAE